ncbi:hypothetical protein BGS_0851 [Beggiatoa sp. SS]|nr:hypothetical protein BGS_0851 [Beggiatoa sp. SS]
MATFTRKRGFFKVIRNVLEKGENNSEKFGKEKAYFY